MGRERLLVGFTNEALSGMVKPPQDNGGEVCDWVSVHEWLQMQRSLYTEPVPLIAIIHRVFEDKQLAAINLQERFGFSPKVIGILRADSDGLDEVVRWFPGGSDCVRPGDKLLCHADMIDVQLLQPKLDLAFESDRRAHLSLQLLLRKKLFQIRAELQQSHPRHIRSVHDVPRPLRRHPDPELRMPPSNRSVSPITPRLRNRSRSRSPRGSMRLMGLVH